MSLNQYEIQIVEKIQRRFNEAELRDLCFRLDIDYDDLVGLNRSGKARELVLRCEREGRLQDVVTVCEKMRPKETWRKIEDKSDQQPELLAREPIRQDVAPWYIRFPGWRWALVGLIVGGFLIGIVWALSSKGNSEQDEKVTAFPMATIELTAIIETGTPTPLPITQLTDKVCAFPVKVSFQVLWETYRSQLGCPIGIANILPRIAEQSFQGGHMFWRQDTDDTYIIYDRRLNEHEINEGTWLLNPVEWKWDGSYADGTNLTPPEDLYEPLRGFGWLWRTYYGGSSGELGWALDKEYGWDNLAIAQDFEGGLIFQTSAPEIYILTTDGRFIRFKPTDNQ